MTFQRPHLLALDGDQTILRAIAQIAAPYYETLTTGDPRRLLGWLEAYDDVAAIITEHVLETAIGVTLLESARNMRPRVRRVLMTTYHDLSAIIDGIHSGAIERLVPKPFNANELLGAILPEELAKPSQARRASA